MDCNDDVKIVLPESIRSKKNSKRPVQVGGRNVPKRLVILPSKAYQRWEKKARWVAKSQFRGTRPTRQLLHVQVAIHYKGRMPDLSGCLESVGDCLEGIVWKDDKQIMSWDGSRLYHDIKNPRTEVIVREYTANEDMGWAKS